MEVGTAHQRKRQYTRCAFPFTTEVNFSFRAHLLYTEPSFPGIRIETDFARLSSSGGLEKAARHQRDEGREALG